MALIENFERENLRKPKVDKPVHRATYSIDTIDGTTFLKIRTFGAANRLYEYDPSQIIQLGPEAIEQLKLILAEV